MIRSTITLAVAEDTLAATTEQGHCARRQAMAMDRTRSRQQQYAGWQASPRLP